MLGKFKLWSLSSMALLLTMVANTGIGIRCYYFLYEPDIPEKLKVEL